MKRTLFLLATVILCTGRALAQSDDADFLKKLEGTFETPGTVAAKDFIPAAQMSGSLHTVRPLADNDGLRNTYYVDTPSGVQEVTGTPALVQRIREIYALDYLRGVSRSGEFTKAIANTGKAKIESAAKMVTDPFGTIKNVPKGASRFFGRIGEGMKGGASKTEGSGLEGVLGISEAKAKLALKLGVSPYSTNEELQRELTKVAQAVAGGGMAVSVASSFATGGAGAALTVVGANETLTNTLTSSTPDDLRIMDRKKLLALGVSRPLVEEFVMHPWFSPWMETITVDSLARIGVNPSAFLKDAVGALTDEDAFYFQRIAQILAKYHTTSAPLRSIQIQNGVITALDKNGILVVPVSMDYAIWAERMARRTEEFVALDRAKEHITGLALWTDGQLSNQLVDELKKRGIGFRVSVLEGAGR